MREKLERSRGTLNNTNMTGKGNRKNALADAAAELAAAATAASSKDSAGKNWVPKLTSLLADLLLSRDKVTLEDLESGQVRAQLAGGIFAACKLVPTPIAEITIRLAMRAIMRRVAVQWHAGENFAMIQRVREAFAGLTRDFDSGAERELGARLPQCEEYKDMLGQWLTQFGSMVVLTTSEQQLFEEAGSALNPSKLLAPLVEKYPLLIDHAMVQEGLDYLGGKLQGLVGYHALFRHATHPHENPKVSILAALAMAAEYFDPDVKPAYRKLPQKAVTAFDLNASDDVVSALVYDQETPHGSLCGQPAFPQRDSVLFAEAVSTRNVLAVLNDCDNREQQRPTGPKKKQQQQQQHGRRRSSSSAASAASSGVAWRCGLEALLSLPLEYLALDLPIVLHMFYEPPQGASQEHERVLALYATNTADALAKFPELAASGGLEAVIRSLTVRGFTRSNCEKYLAAAEAFFDERTFGTPVGDFLTAVIYASVVGLAAHSMYAANQRTALYPEKYSLVVKETIEPYVYLLNMVGLSGSDVLIPLRAFAPQPQDHAFRAIRDTLAAVVDGAESGGEELGDMVVYDYVQRLTSDFHGEVQESARWLNERDAVKLHRKNLAPQDRRDASSDSTGPVPGFQDLAALAQRLQIEGEEPEAVVRAARASGRDVDATFSALFAASVVRDVMEGAASVPFERRALARLDKVLAWMRDFGLSWNMPDSGRYRRHIMGLQAALHPFASGELSTDAVTVKQAQTLQNALEELHSACEHALRTLPLPYVDGLRKILPPTRHRSPLLAQAYANAAAGDLGSLTAMLSKTSDEISQTVKSLVTRLMAVKDLFSRHVSAEGTNHRNNAVAVASAAGTAKLGAWTGDAIMTGLWKTVNFTEAAIRNAERVVRELEATKNKTQTLEDSYWQVASSGSCGGDGGDANAGESLYKQVATELSNIADARNSVIVRSRALYRAIANTGLKRIRDFVKAWRMFLKAEQGLTKQLVQQQDLVEALSAVAFSIEAHALQQQQQQPPSRNGEGWRELETKYAATDAERDLAVAEMLGPRVSRADDGSSMLSRDTVAFDGKGGGALITASSDVKSWDKTNKAPLSEDYSFSEYPPRDYQKLIPDKIIPTEETLKLSDRILSGRAGGKGSDGEDEDNMMDED